MRRPYPIADRRACNRNPDQPRPGLRRNGAMKNRDGNNACNEANQAGEQNEPPIMIGSKTAENTKHIVDPIGNTVDETSD
ncbi:hypothetical protein [Bradyrhizobium sp. CCBAU 051011]|uniref:hypothetical protein n=1 Tax=Bradyrhizobium sp. CCBAU 051011 TaxID=858422 RepID=UPI001FEDACA3|nr:hypothetical protein [Bradyrhizobium sp. CCBAU 051011]